MFEVRLSLRALHLSIIVACSLIASLSSIMKKVAGHNMNLNASYLREQYVLLCMTKCKEDIGGQFFVDPRIRWKTLGSSLSIHGLINLGGILLREKLHDHVRLRYINWGAKEHQQDSFSNCSKLRMSIGRVSIRSMRENE